MEQRPIANDAMPATKPTRNHDPNVGIGFAEGFAAVDAFMQVSHMLTFLYIARRGVCSQTDIERALGISTSAANRNINYWTDRKTGGEDGKGFVTKETDPKDNRFKMLSLTKKGQEFYAQLKAGDVKVKKRA